MKRRSRPPLAPELSIPIFLIDDNRLLRDGLASMLGAEGLKVVATARSGAEAEREVTRTQPQIVLLDSALGDRDAARLIQQLRRDHPGIRVIVMGLLPAHDDFVEFIRAGAAGFILKDATIDEFVQTIMQVANGASVLPSLMTETLFMHVAAQTVTRGKKSARAAIRMTKREREVTALIAEGLSNKEIATRLHVALHTVKSHVHNILEKLALHTRLEVAAYAHQEPETAAPV